MRSWSSGGNTSRPVTPTARCSRTRTSVHSFDAPNSTSASASAGPDTLVYSSSLMPGLVVGKAYHAQCPSLRKRRGSVSRSTVRTGASSCACASISRLVPFPTCLSVKAASSSLTAARSTTSDWSTPEMTCAGRDGVPTSEAAPGSSRQAASSSTAYDWPALKPVSRLVEEGSSGVAEWLGAA